MRGIRKQVDKFHFLTHAEKNGNGISHGGTICFLLSDARGQAEPRLRRWIWTVRNMLTAERYYELPENIHPRFNNSHPSNKPRPCQKDCVNNCLNAFESCLKVICKKRGWNYTEKDTANRLIAIVFDKELIQPFMQSHFLGLRSVLESGVPTFRNKQTGHGQGPEEITIPEYIASYILHLTASNILLLAKADQDMK